MKWRRLLRYLLPKEEEKDPRFRRALDDLSVIGLRVIAGVSIGSPLFGLVAGLTWAKGTYHSVKGPVSVEWSLVSGTMKLDLTIPPGIQATVWLPDERKWVEVAPGRHQWPQESADQNGSE